MSGIRKQAIVSSILVYIGTGIGAINTYFYVSLFTKDEYGLTKLFYDVGLNFYIFASLGAIPVLYKFYPYYKDNLEDKQNDLLGRSLIISGIGFILVCIAAYFAEPLIIQKFAAHSNIFINYYFWVLPFAFGLLLFSLLEGYAWVVRKSVISNFLRETGLRLFTLVFILLYWGGLITFHTFMILFSTLFLIIALILLAYFMRRGQVHFTLKKSRVTKKYKKKMFGMQALIFGGIIITTLGQTIDTFVIASLLGTADAGIYTLSLYMSNLIQIPQRSIQSIATGILARNWKDKNYADIIRIYQRSSINMLIISIFIFGNMWLNIADGLTVLNLFDKYKEGIPLILVFGIIRVIDAGTGVNSQIIGTSNFWRFEFLSGVVMLALRIPLSYFLVKSYGIVGSAYSDLISLTVYNFIRYEFLRRKFGMQPFSSKTFYSLILAFAAYFSAYFLLQHQSGWLAIILRSAIFSGIIAGGVFLFKLTPDALQIYDNIKKRFNVSNR
ncbi:MAG: oligosaccharide flippase family protein [Panacibacter sp.]